MRSMMDNLVASSTPTNGQNAVRVIGGQNGPINEMSTFTRTGLVWNKEKHGGKARMENNGIRPGVKVTMALVGSTNMARAAAASTGTPMSSKTPGMRDFQPSERFYHTCRKLLPAAIIVFGAGNKVGAD